MGEAGWLPAAEGSTQQRTASINNPVQVYQLRSGTSMPSFHRGTASNGEFETGCEGRGWGGGSNNQGARGRGKASKVPGATVVCGPWTAVRPVHKATGVGYVKAT